MATTAQSVLRRCIVALNDTTSVRWPLNELTRYLNDGQREIIMHRPDSLSTNATLVLAAGSKQALPAGATKLVDVIRNTTAGNKSAVRQVNREILDAQIPGWHGITGVAEIKHFTYDPRDPKVFYVYPPAGTGGTAASLEIVYAATPTDIALPADGTTITLSLSDTDTSVISGNLSVNDLFSNPLQDYILYRAWSKDAEYAANAPRATAHYTSFANALGIEVRATVSVAPTQVSNPNNRPMAVPQA